VVAGLCHGVQGTYAYLADVLGVPYGELEARSAGLNHLLWLQSLRYKGKDVMGRLKRLMPKHKDDDGRRFAWAMYEIYGAFPINRDKHTIEFYPYLRQARKLKELPYGLTLRRHECMGVRRRAKSAKSEYELIAEGKKPFRPPDAPIPENLGALIAGAESDSKRVNILNVANDGAIPNLPAFANVEVEAILEKDRVRALQMDPLPLGVVGIQALRAWQFELLVEASVRRSRKLALQAMAADPMVLSLAEARSLLDAFCKAHRIRLS